MRNPRRSVSNRLLPAVLLCATLVAPAAADDEAHEGNITTWIVPPPSHHKSLWGLLDFDRTHGSAPPWRRAQTLTGDWGGVRDQIADEYGISLVGNYTSECAGNPIGGREQGVTYTHNIGIALLVDLGKLVGLDETYFIVSGSNRAGSSDTGKYIGNIYPVQQIYGGETTRLVQLAFGKRLFDGALDIVAGRIHGLDDFIALPLYCDAQNLAFCGNPLSIPSDINIPSYPNALWGARARWEPVSMWYWMGGVYNAYAGFRANKFHGVDFSIRHNSGVVGIMETGLLPDEAGWVPEGMEGHLKLGGYYDTEPLKDFGTGLLERGTWGIYVALDQQVYAERGGEDGQGLSLFTAFHHAPPDVNTQTDFFDFGAVYQGAIPGRDTDVLGFFVAHGWISGDLRASQTASGQPGQVQETVLELNYRWNVLPWLYFQPDVQGILNPGGADQFDDALVLAIQFGFPF